MEKMTTRDKVIVAITVILVIGLFAAAFYDRNSALLSRTLAYEIPEDLELVDIDKHGFMFYRVGYEAKFEIDPENPEEILQQFVIGYDFSGTMLSESEYREVAELYFGEDGEFSYVDLQPAPASGTSVWMMQVITEDEHEIVHFIDLEAGNHAYLYIYYVR